MKFSPEEIKRQTRRLWRTCFEDSDEFINLYFRLKYSDETNVVLCRDGKVAAAVQVFPYKFRLGTSELPCGYISGLATMPELRHQGLATEVLLKAHVLLRKRGAVLSFLIPQNEDLRFFYASPKRGAYQTMAFRKEVTFKSEQMELIEGGKLEIVEVEANYGELFPLFGLLTANEPAVVLPAEHDFETALQTVILEGGKVRAVRRSGRFTGLCFAVPEGPGNIFLRTLFAEDEASERALLRSLFREFGVSEIHRRVPAMRHEAGALPYAMVHLLQRSDHLAHLLCEHPLRMELLLDE